MSDTEQFGTVPFTAPGMVPRPRPPEPDVIGRYRIVRRIGVGGMGVVYQATDLDRARVAVKVIHPEFAGDPDFRERFAHEVEMLTRVEDEHAVSPITADTAANRPWLAMRYVPGPTLNERISEDGPLSGADLLTFVHDMAQALIGIHRAGIVHRDLKPDNVILSPQGLRVLDFGIARRLDEAGDDSGDEIFGSPGWVSPEQLRDHAPDTPADVFAWGGLVAYAATGRRPFGVGPGDVVAVRVLRGDADLHGVPRALRPMVESALRTDPTRRPQPESLLRSLAHLTTARPPIPPMAV